MPDLSKIVGAVLGVVLMGFCAWVILRPRRFIACEC